MVFAWLPQSSQTFSKFPAACLSLFASSDISQAAPSVTLSFHQGNFSLPHPVLALLGNRKGGEGGRKVDKP